MSGNGKAAVSYCLGAIGGRFGKIPNLKPLGFFLVLTFILPKAFSQCNALIGTNIDPAEGCTNLGIQFSDLSTGVVSRTWDFGDGSPTVVAQNPSHSFTAGNKDTTFTVKLTITCASGSSSTTKNIRVFAKPIVGFTLNKPSVCAITDSICLDNKSIYSPNYSYLWNFGDGTISEKYQPCKTYSTPGTYDISLQVINERGCLGTLTSEDIVTVERIPSTAFSVNAFSGCRPFNVVFTNNTDTVGNDYSDWLWDFGDGEPAFVGFTPPTHTYTDPGEYTVTLGTTNSLGCYNFSTQKITVKPAPVASFIASTPVCQNENLLVQYNGSYNSAPTFKWSFDSAFYVSGAGEGPYLVRWKEPGNKTINLTVIEDECSSSVSGKIQVNPITKVELSVSADLDTICSGEAVTFTASPSNFANYVFYVNAGIVQQSNTNTYIGTGLHNNDKIYVKITDLNGCTEIVSDTMTLTVFESPVISITSSTLNDTICFAENLTVTALPDGFDEYSFYVGNTLIKTGVENTFSISTLLDKERIYATAKSGICYSGNSNNIITTVKDVLPAPQVFCGSTTTGSIEFQWDEVPDAVAYEISLDNAAFVTPNSGAQGLTHTMNGLPNLEEHSIRVRAVDPGICGIGLVSSVTTCAAIDCIPILFDLKDQKRETCENDEVSLSVSGISITDYSIMWNNDPAENNELYEFTASISTSVPVIVSNLSSPLCPSVEKFYDIEVATKPILSLQSSVPGNLVCEGTPITFTAQPENLETYSFYENNALVKEGPDNFYTMLNPVNGRRVYVSATQDACLVSTDPLTVNVSNPLNIPAVNYTVSTETTVLFAWSGVSGAIAYQVSVNGGPFIEPSSGPAGLSHLVTSLLPGDAVTLSVMAMGDGICGNSDVSQPAIGFAENCTAFDYSIQENHNLCLGDSLTLKIEGLNLSNYEIAWGSLAPSQLKSITVKPGVDTIISVAIKNLDKPYCPRQISYVNIKVNHMPDAVSLSASDPDNLICEDEIIRFTASPGGYDVYEFFSGFNRIASGANNFYETSAMSDGQSIKARAINQGCIGAFGNEISIAVNEKLGTPQVNPGVSTSSTISFVWDSIPGATAYNISIDGLPFVVPSSGATGRFHEITGLNLGDSAKARVVAIGADPCGNSNISIQVTGYANNCDAITFKMKPYFSICQGEDILLSISDIEPVTYAVSWSGNAFGPDTSIVHTGSSDTIITVSVRNTSQIQCPSVNRYFEIDVTNIPQITLVSDALTDTICRGQDVKFTVTPQQFSKYVFYDGLNIVQDAALSTYTILNPANGTNISVEVASNGCSAKSNSIQTVIIEPKTLNLTASKTGSLCLGEQVQFTATSGFERYIFRDNESIISQSTSNVADINVNNSSITVVALDEFNCRSRSQDTLKFNLLPLPSVEIGCSIDTICYSEFATYFAEPAGLPEYRFYSNDILLLQSGTKNIYSSDSIKAGNRISVVGVDNNGCMSQPSVSLFPYIYPYPNSSIGAEATGICLNDSVKLFVNKDNSFASASYYWSSGQTADTIKVSPAYSSKFALYYNFAQCSNKVLDTKTVEVDRQPIPVANAGDDVTICIYDSIQLEATGGLHYNWNNAFTLDDTAIFNPYAKPLTSTTYIVRVANDYCFSVDSVRVIIDLCLTDITDLVPQIITPNNDGFNDFWIVSNVDYFENNSVEIYNRWGSLVYKASPYTNTWDGKNNNGNDLPDGTFFYILNLGNGSAPRTGFIIIHR